MDIITSVKNPNVLALRNLLEKKGREQADAFLAEGANLVGDMPAAETVFALYVREDCTEKFMHITKKATCPVYVLKTDVFNRAVDTQSPAGIAAVVMRKKEKPLTAPVVLLLDGIRDPGNLGTLIRTAAATGYTDLVLAACADIYNPKTVRATMGGIFHVNAVCAARGALTALLADYPVFGLDMQGENVFGFTPPAKFALAVGSEAQGLSQEVRTAMQGALSVPMRGGHVESLNAAVSAGIAMSVMSEKMFGGAK